MNEWENAQKQDAEPFKYWGCPQTKEWVVKYETSSHYWQNSMEKKSKWWELRHKTKNILRSIFIAPFIHLKESVMMFIASKWRCNKVDVEQLQHELKMANARIQSLEMTRLHLVEHANKAYDTLAAYRKLDEDARAEQAKKKKAAKKRPSAKKKRKG